MRKKILSLLCAGTMIAGACAGFVACGEKDTRESVILWVSETSGMPTLTQSQANAFLAATDVAEYKNYKVVVRGVSESEAATQMTNDVKTGADIYCFAQDQMARLIEANALMELSGDVVTWINENNDATSAQGCKVDNKTWCFPLTSDNTYIMYYNKETMAGVDMTNFEAIVDKCVETGTNFSFELGGSAWYTASFFMGAGGVMNWQYNTETKLWTAGDTFGSTEVGQVALEGMQYLTKKSIWVDASKAAGFEAATPSSVVVTGTWDSDTAKSALKQNFGVAVLPKYHVGGQEYQLKGFLGCKFMGIKPQTDAIKGAFCRDLAQYLTNKENSIARFEKAGWGPSNKAAQIDDKIKDDPILLAVKQAFEVGVPQGNIHGGWWDFAKLLGSGSKDAEATVAGRQKLLDDYNASIAKYESMTEEEMNAFGVIGSIASLEGNNTLAYAQDKADAKATWATWGTDLKMEKSEDGLVWTSPAVVLAADDEFQVRQGQAWNVQYGNVADDGYSTKDNFKITSANAGTWKIRLTLTADGKKGTVSLVAAE